MANDRFMADEDMIVPAGGKTAPVVVHVFENTHMLLGRGWGVLTFMLTCVTCTC